MPLDTKMQIPREFEDALGLADEWAKLSLPAVLTVFAAKGGVTPEQLIAESSNSERLQELIRDACNRNGAKLREVVHNKLG